jgi:hypothetical protein
MYGLSENNPAQLADTIAGCVSMNGVYLDAVVRDDNTGNLSLGRVWFQEDRLILSDEVNSLSVPRYVLDELIRRELKGK